MHERVLFATYDSSLADTMIKEYAGPLMEHQMSVSSVSSGITRGVFKDLQLQLLENILASAEGDYAIRSMDGGHLVHARIGDEVYLAA